MTSNEQNELPEVTKSMMFSWYDKRNKINNLVLPLTNYEIVFYEKDQIIKIPVPSDLLNKFPVGYVKKWAFTQTDDPRIEWAADWSDMGTFRLVHKGVKSNVSKIDAGIQIRVARKNYGKDMWMPDKVRFDMYERGQAQ